MRAVGRELDRALLAYHALSRRSGDRECRHLRRSRVWVFVQEYLKTHPCTCCGEADITRLDFIHVRGQRQQNIQKMVRDRRSIESVKKELKKCEVRCDTCDRVRS